MADPKIGAKKPAVMELTAGKYPYCTCGEAANPAICDGAHKGTDFKPQIFELAETKTVALCQCKRTGNPPYCDGSHAGLD